VFILHFSFAVLFADVFKFFVFLVLLGLLFSLAALSFEELVLEFVHFILLLQIDVASPLPLLVHFVALLVRLAQFLRHRVQLNLRGLRLGDFLVNVDLAFVVVDCELLDGEREFLDLDFVLPALLLQSEVVFLLLAGGQRPLLQLVLVPIHFQFKLVEFLVA